MNIRAYAAAFAATFMTVVLAGLHSRSWWLAVIPAVLYVGSWVDNWVGFAFSREQDCVYYLYDSARRLVYVGETNDIERRCLEHTNPTSPDRKPSVRYVQIARDCRTDRQAKRIEARRIRALTRAHRHAWTGPLLNEIWTVPSRNPAVRLWVCGWMVAYLCESWLHPDRRWHAPNPAPYLIPEQDAEPDDGDYWDPPDDPYDDPSPPTDDNVTEATYARPLIHALGPAGTVTRNDVTDPDPSPRRGDSQTRNASRNATSRTDRSQPMTNAERQRAWRQRQKQRQADK